MFAFLINGEKRLLQGYQELFKKCIKCGFVWLADFEGCDKDTLGKLEGIVGSSAAII